MNMWTIIEWADFLLADLVIKSIKLHPLLKLQEYTLDGKK